MLRLVETPQLHAHLLYYSKMNADKRVESPIPLLPLSTPDEETEKLIKRKDEEVSETRLLNKPQILNDAPQQELRNRDADVKR